MKNVLSSQFAGIATCCYPTPLVYKRVVNQYSSLQLALGSAYGSEDKARGIILKPRARDISHIWLTTHTYFIYIIARAEVISPPELGISRPAVILHIYLNANNTFKLLEIRISFQPMQFVSPVLDQSTISLEVVLKFPTYFSVCLRYFKEKNRILMHCTMRQGLLVTSLKLHSYLVHCIWNKCFNNTEYLTQLSYLSVASAASIIALARAENVIKYVKSLYSHRTTAHCTTWVATMMKWHLGNQKNRGVCRMVTRLSFIHCPSCGQPIRAQHKFEMIFRFEENALCFIDSNIRYNATGYCKTKTRHCHTIGFRVYYVDFPEHPLI